MPNLRRNVSNQAENKKAETPSRAPAFAFPL